jgi:hypothetical protein
LNSSDSSAVLENPSTIADSMFYIFFIVILNLAFGFALAVYLGGHYCMIRKFGVKIPFPLKTVPSLVKTTAAASVTNSEPSPTAKTPATASVRESEAPPTDKTTAAAPAMESEAPTTDTTTATASVTDSESPPAASEEPPELVAESALAN